MGMAKIIRKEYTGETTNRVVISDKATREHWQGLINRCRNKCNCSALGLPEMTIWKNKVTLRTQTGHNLEFQYIN